MDNFFKTIIIKNKLDLQTMYSNLMSYFIPASILIMKKKEFIDGLEQEKFTIVKNNDCSFIDNVNMRKISDKSPVSWQTKIYISSNFFILKNKFFDLYFEFR